MESLDKNLNLVRLQGTPEQQEESRLLFIELIDDIRKNNPGIPVPDEEPDFPWVDSLDLLKSHLPGSQLDLLDCYLKNQAKEIISRRERDITLI